MGLRESLKGKRFRNVTFCLLLFCAFIWVVLQIKETEQAVFNSSIKCQLGPVSFGVSNYRVLKGTSVFEDALQQGVSWRQLLAESSDDFLETTRGSGTERTVPHHLRTRKPPSLAWFDSDYAVPSDYLTCFHAIRLSGDSAKNDPVWLISYIPQKPIQWLSTDDLSLEEFDSLVHADTKQRIHCLIPEEPRTVQRSRLFEILQAAKAGEKVKTFTVNE